MLIVANWKAYVDSKAKAQKLFSGAKLLTKSPDTQIVLAMPTPYIGMLGPTNRSKVSIAAQNISNVEGGAATGEVTAKLLRDLGAIYTLIGHSERRAMGETDEMVAQKIQLAFANKITPIVCIGERERDADAKYLAALRAQMHAIFEPLAPKDRLRVVIAYEPIWAIGKPANEAITANDLTEMILYIRKVIGAYIPDKGVEKVNVLYGGSVEASNAQALLGDSGINGLLVGRASVDTDSFARLVKAALKK